MCGIVAYVGNKECAPLLVDGLRKLEYRGYDSAGLAVHTGRGIEIVRAVGKLSNLDAALRSPGLFLVGEDVVREMRPVRSPSQYSAVVLPMGVTAPRPVTTTRWISRFMRCLAFPGRPGGVRGWRCSAGTRGCSG